MVSVPRLYEKIYSTARHKVSKASAAKRQLFDWAVGVGQRGTRYAKKRGERRGAVRWPRSTRWPTGWCSARSATSSAGRRTSSRPAAPRCSAEIEEFFFAAGLLVCQGYGLTETSPMLTCNRPGDFRFGTVGKVIPGCEVQIAPDGEILARGRNVMRGYFGKPEETAEAFEDGWFKTGDIGAFDEDGFLRITDRKKDLIITSGGKNIAPSRIESIDRAGLLHRAGRRGRRRPPLPGGAGRAAVRGARAVGDGAGHHLRLAAGDGQGPRGSSPSSPSGSSSSRRRSRTTSG